MSNVIQLHKGVAQHCATWRNRAAVRRLHREVLRMRDATPCYTSADAQMRHVLAEAAASLQAMRRLSVLRYVRARG